MFRRTLLAMCGAAALLAGSASVASADVVFSLSPDWVLLPGSLGPATGTWGLPADLTAIGCGTENETTCEPTGIWGFDHPFVGGPGTGPGFFIMTDGDTGGLSDIIIFDNSGASGNGLIRFYSDPNLPQDVMQGLIDNGVLCVEGANGGNGCVGTFTMLLSGGGIVTIDAASDSEITFDPNGFGVDTSDQIRFTGVSVTTAPEPSTIMMIAVALLAMLGLGTMRRRADA